MYKPSGVSVLNRVLRRSKKVLVYYDPDLDGVGSGNLVERFLKKYNIPYSCYINENRKHGFLLSDEQIDKLRGWTIIVVDALMNRLEIEKVVSKGIDIVNIDHHDIAEKDIVYIEKGGKEGVIINNQYPFEPKEFRFLSGCGMVYYCLEAICEGFATDDMRVIVGITLLSDIRQIESKEAEYFLDYTYNYRSPYTKYLISVTENEIDYGFGVPSLDRNYIDYTLAPKINALFRLNKGDEAIELLRGNYSRGDRLITLRNIQNTIVEDMMDFIEVREYDNLIVGGMGINDISCDYDITNFIGLVASKLKNETGKTVLAYIDDGGGNILRGSVRGLSDDVNYLEVFRKGGLQCEGHEIAFGVKGGIVEDRLKVIGSELAKLEKGHMERKYEGRIVEVGNLGFFMSRRGLKMAKENAYVREVKRKHIKYKGVADGVVTSKRGTCTEYTVDGIPVLCFEDITVKEGLITPIEERNGYITYYLRKY